MPRSPHGAARQPGEVWFEAAVAALALAAAASALLGGSVRARARRPAWWGVALLAAFAAWSGVTLAWSIAPDRTWEELNRAIAYPLVAFLGIAVGASVGRAVERFATGWLVVSAAVALYALGGKVAPGLHVHPFFDLNPQPAVGRLRTPLEYWNALALLCVLAAPVALRIATDATRRAAPRLAALEALYLFALVAGMTYSRGGIVAFAVAVAVLTALGGARLRGLVALAAVALATVAPLAIAFGRPGLKANGVDLAVRIHEGRILGAAVVGCGLVLLGAGIGLGRLEARIRWSPARSARVWRTAGAAAAVALALLVVGLARSERGLGGTISHAVSSFTTTRQDRQFDPVRLLSTNSSNRWVWWKEAAGAFSDRPAGGWGAGSFALLHLRYRTEPIPVTQAHSVPLQMLAETGIVGLLLAAGGLLALLAAAVARVRAMRPGRSRDLAVALLAAAAAWTVHATFDWDWNIPAVTAPVLAMLGVIAGAAGTGARARPDAISGEEEGAPGRSLLLVAATVAAVAVVISAALPAWADHNAARAAATASSGKRADLVHAAAQADLAARLDPLATRPLFVAAAVAEARERLLEARADLLEAADRRPGDPAVWLRLSGIALRLADRDGLIRAAQRALALDPANPAAAALLKRALAAQTPPEASATATGTPLPAAPAAAAAPPVGAPPAGTP